MKYIAKKGTIQSMESIPKSIRDIFVVSYDISPEYHIKIQAAFQKHVENAVSKTINLPENQKNQYEFLGKQEYQILILEEIKHKLEKEGFKKIEESNLATKPDRALKLNNKKKERNNTIDIVRDIRKEYLEVLLSDPFLPKELLPDNWMGEKVKKLMRNLGRNEDVINLAI